MKKRIFALALAALLACSFSASAVSADGGFVPTSMAIATGNSSGTVYYIGAGISNVLNEKMDIQFTAEATNGGPLENCTFVHENADMIGLAALDGAKAAVEGDAERGFREAMDNIKLLMVGHMTTIYMAATEKSGIESVADFPGKKLGWPTIGTSAYYIMNTVCEAYGIDPSTLNASPISLSDQVDAMKDGQLDLFSGAGAIPMAGCTELALSVPVKWLSLEDEEINAKILEANNAWEINTMEAGVYEGQDYDVKLIQIPMALVCNAELDDEVAYEIVRNICENTADIEAVHSEGKEWKAENNRSLFENPVIEFHPGAAKYFEEVFG